MIASRDEGVKGQFCHIRLRVGDGLSQLVGNDFPQSSHVESSGLNIFRNSVARMTLGESLEFIPDALQVLVIELEVAGVHRFKYPLRLIFRCKGNGVRSFLVWPADKQQTQAFALR
jgi:hypothetical protein